MLGKSVSGGFRRCCFEVVEIMVHFLILNKSLTHVVEYFDSEFLRDRVRQVFSDPVGVEAGLIHTDQTDR